MGKLSGRTMGTTYSVKYHGDGVISSEKVHEQIDAALSEVNQQMSTYLPESELSQFNSSDSTNGQSVSPATAYVVGEAVEIHQQTDGAFDVTVGPLVKLWKLNDPKSSPIEPTDDQIEQARERTGIDKLAVQTSPPMLSKSNPRLEIDLSAIAKGFGVDRVCEVLNGLGIVNFMVEIGGEVRASGVREDGKAWRIGVESPQVGQRDLTRVIPLANYAMATSGDYRNFRGKGPAAYTHILDPRTGRPLAYRGVSVTVLAKTCLEADALATALVVMGQEKGAPWCEEHGVAALFQHRTSDGPSKAYATSAFDKLAPTGKPARLE
ncbi:FAD:protein FMN transferase [Adhaeretor mobilis]|uniref:FAD:protein FMN transferase n=1 Tax=Adhaeretor mobilis TaxID=1930276 RepID=A0A517MVV7_9BACT|nr:FAD:protein FMN transferase [Adhaeretor mobilis]QDS99011.1 Thiamine biosynthesis lipoprotein ApbE precursor [Adhaeretor mobilis]